MLADISKHLTQYKGFISSFDELVNSNNINVITDSYNNMSLDVPKNMSSDTVEHLTKKVNILDGLNKTRQEYLT